MAGNEKSENNVYDEALDDGNSDVQSKRQIRGVNLSLFRNDRSSTFSVQFLGTQYNGYSTAAMLSGPEVIKLFSCSTQLSMKF